MAVDDQRPPKTPDAAESESFLSRWARRKEAMRQSEREGDPEADDSSTAEATTPPSADAADTDAVDAEPERVLTDADMPDIDSLTPDSDVSGFFSPGVSEALRKKALRKLFHTSRFNIKDGLDDYDDDYTLLQPMGDMVPWDMKRQQERLEERRRRAAEAANDETIDEMEDPSPVDAAEAEDASAASVAPETTDDHSVDDAATEASSTPTDNSEEPDHRA